MAQKRPSVLQARNEAHPVQRLENSRDRWHFQFGRNDKMKNLLKRLWQEEEGQDLVEYALLLVLISLGSIAAMQTLATGISKAYGNASTSLS